MIKFEPQYRYDIVQSSDRWFHHKLGKVSASESRKLFVKPKLPTDPEELAKIPPDDLRRTWGRGAITYLHKLAQEYVTRDRISISTKSLAWGHYYEDEARMLYEDMTGNKVTQVGFIDMFPGVGCSPDGLVGEDGVIEIKCPSSQEVFNTYRAGLKNYLVPTKHRCQLYHNTIGSKRKWCDYIIYDPRLIGYDRIEIVRVPIDSPQYERFGTPQEFLNRLLKFRNSLSDEIKQLFAIQEQQAQKEQQIQQQFNNYF